MSSLAGILQDLNFDVVGSDVDVIYFTNSTLNKRGIEILPFKTQNLKGDYFYIIGMGYNQYNNEEVKEIFEKNYNYMYYNDFINKMFGKVKIGVSGSHGKTTTTSIISKLLHKKRVCALIGDSTGFGKPNYDYFVFEACEYKDTFLAYNYDYLIINNIDFDHVDYFRDIDDVISSFQKAADKAKILIINNDDKNCIKIKHNNKFTFGRSLNSDLVIYKIHQYLDKVRVDYIYKERVLSFNLKSKGLHNIYNFSASLLLLLILDEDLDIQNILDNFVMPKRRMEVRRYDSNIIIDDYAHHPTEIKCFIDEVKKTYPDKELVIAFTPHTYSRTLKLKEEFQTCFDKASKVYYFNTFTSRESYSPLLEKEVDEVFKNYEKISLSSCETLLNLKDKVIAFLGAGNHNSSEVFNEKQK